MGPLLAAVCWHPRRQRQCNQIRSWDTILTASIGYEEPVVDATDAAGFSGYDVLH
jgi:hypothetical protein